MKLIIAGGRNLQGSQVKDILQSYSDCCHGDNYVFDPLDIVEVVCGEARGIDTQGKCWAKENNISVKKFPANWDKYKKAAGPIRNRQMAKYADVLLLVWDGESRGSSNMKKEMEKLNKPVFEIIIKE